MNGLSIVERLRIAKSRLGSESQEEATIRRNRTITEAADTIEALVSAAGEYTSQFGQALEAHGIPYGPAQIAAAERLRATLAKVNGIGEGASDGA